MKFHNGGAILKGATDPHDTYQQNIRPKKIRLGIEYVQKLSILMEESAIEGGNQ